jgi:ribosomal protein L34
MDLPMDPQPGKKSHQQRAIELLAQESQVPVDEVARLYRNEWAELEDGARVTGFVAILATRNVREVLRRRRIGKRPLA